MDEKREKESLESNQHKKSIILNVICSHVTFIAKVFCKIKRRKTKGKVFNGAGKWCAFNVTDLFNYWWDTHTISKYIEIRANLVLPQTMSFQTCMITVMVPYLDKKHKISYFDRYLTLYCSKFMVNYSNFKDFFYDYFI